MQTINCGHCGNVLLVPLNAEAFTCGVCGTVNRVQQRSYDTVHSNTYTLLVLFAFLCAALLYNVYTVIFPYNSRRSNVGMYIYFLSSSEDQSSESSSSESVQSSSSLFGFGGVGGGALTDKLAISERVRV